MGYKYFYGVYGIKLVFTCNMWVRTGKDEFVGGQLLDIGSVNSSLVSSIVKHNRPL